MQYKHSIWVSLKLIHLRSSEPQEDWTIPLVYLLRSDRENNKSGSFQFQTRSPRPPPTLKYTHLSTLSVGQASSCPFKLVGSEVSPQVWCSFESKWRYSIRSAIDLSGWQLFLFTVSFYEFVWLLGEQLIWSVDGDRIKIYVWHTMGIYSCFSTSAR